jgi:hypothetical protein
LVRYSIEKLQQTCYIDDVHSLKNSKFIKIAINDTTDTARSASLLDLQPRNWQWGHAENELYDKRDEFNFPGVKRCKLLKQGFLVIKLKSLCR